MEKHAGTKRRRFTVNIGVATFPADASDPMSLNTRAERALLQAKQGDKGVAPAVAPLEKTAIN